MTFPHVFLAIFPPEAKFPSSFFSISVIRFLPILYRGLGHHFCICRASLVPLWVPLPLFSSPPGLFCTLLAAARGLKRQSFLTRRTLTKHAQACTDRASRPTPNRTETGPSSRGLPKSQKWHRERIQRAPGDTHKGVRGGPGNPRGSLASAKEPPEAV